MYWSPRFCASLSITLSSLMVSLARLTSPLGAGHRGMPSSRSPSCERSALTFTPGTRQQVPDGAALLVQQSHHYVGRLDQLVIEADGEALRIGQRQLKLAGEFIHSHRNFPSNFSGLTGSRNYLLFVGFESFNQALTNIRKII